jgi:hypothetical protein
MKVAVTTKVSGYAVIAALIGPGLIAAARPVSAGGPYGQARGNTGEDCHTYQAQDLRVQASGDRGWTVSDSRAISVLLDSQADVQVFRRLANAFTTLCTLPGPLTVEYWKGTGPVPLGPRTADEDCNRYDPRRAEIRPAGDLYNLLARPYMLLDVKTQAAADRILEVARDNRLECFIGRGNERPNRLDYIVRYWRK